MGSGVGSHEVGVRRSRYWANVSISDLSEQGSKQRVDLDNRKMRFYVNESYEH